jgi:hypothetical protein
MTVSHPRSEFSSFYSARLPIVSVRSGQFWWSCVLFCTSLLLTFSFLCSKFTLPSLSLHATAAAPILLLLRVPYSLSLSYSVHFLSLFSSFHLHIIICIRLHSLYSLSFLSSSHFFTSSFPPTTLSCSSAWFPCGATIGQAICSLQETGRP